MTHLEIPITFGSLLNLLTAAVHKGRAHVLQQTYRTHDATVDQLLEYAQAQALYALAAARMAALREAQHRQRAACCNQATPHDKRKRERIHIPTTHSTTGTAILPLLDEGEYSVQDNVFSYDMLYEVVRGTHAGLRGTRHELETRLGALHLADPWAAIDALTGAVLYVEPHGYGRWRVKEGG